MERLRKYTRIAPVERFEKLYYRKSPSECWVWKTQMSTYPSFWVPGKERNSAGTIPANRAAWLFYRGAVPDGLSVLHTCDNRLCVNPGHLYLGTQVENNRDRFARGRDNTARGERAYKAKLTEEQVRLIRESKAGVRDLAKEFGVFYTTIKKIRARRSWKHI